MSARTYSRSAYALRVWLILVVSTALATLLTGVAQQSPVIRYLYNDLGLLIKGIDQNGEMAEYVYDAVGNSLKSWWSTLVHWYAMERHC